MPRMSEERRALRSGTPGALGTPSPVVSPGTSSHNIDSSAVLAAVPSHPSRGNKLGDGTTTPTFSAPATSAGVGGSRSGGKFRFPAHPPVAVGGQSQQHAVPGNHHHHHHPRGDDASLSVTPGASPRTNHNPTPPPSSLPRSPARSPIRPPSVMALTLTEAAAAGRGTTARSPAAAGPFLSRAESRLDYGATSPSAARPTSSGHDASPPPPAAPTNSNKVDAPLLSGHHAINVNAGDDSAAGEGARSSSTRCSSSARSGHHNNNTNNIVVRRSGAASSQAAVSYNPLEATGTTAGDLVTPAFAEEQKGEDGRPLLVIQPRASRVLTGLIIALIGAIVMSVVLASRNRFEASGSSPATVYSFAGVAGGISLIGALIIFTAPLLRVVVDPAGGVFTVKLTRVATHLCAADVTHRVSFCSIVALDCEEVGAERHERGKSKVSGPTTSNRIANAMASSDSGNRADRPQRLILRFVLPAENNREMAVELGCAGGALEAAHACLQWEQIFDIRPPPG